MSLASIGMKATKAKCQKHGVTLAEIESVFAGTLSIGPDVAHSTVETRFLAIGRASSGRHVFLALARTGWGQIYPSDQRPLHACEGGAAL
ncbi:BrnT family toxin [Sphingobium quisquiliarum]|uniref:BrnT family toxin n=1 Tax=Sphingobium quisquiliarum TaxID=538379 RepID=UPI00191C0EE7|nr:BrnT family toxin [Sphingobium quisquiliarum]